MAKINRMDSMYLCLVQTEQVNNVLGFCPVKYNPTMQPIKCLVLYSKSPTNAAKKQDLLVSILIGIRLYQGVLAKKNLPPVKLVEDYWITLCPEMKRSVVLTRYE